MNKNVVNARINQWLQIHNQLLIHQADYIVKESPYKELEKFLINTLCYDVYTDTM